MKIRVTMKDPDSMWESVNEAAWAEVRKIEGISDGEAEDLVESRMEEAFDLLEKWVEWKEYVTIEFDTDKGTATVSARK